MKTPILEKLTKVVVFFIDDFTSVKCLFYSYDFVLRLLFFAPFFARLLLNSIGLIKISILFLGVRQN